VRTNFLLTYLLISLGLFAQDSEQKNRITTEAYLAPNYSREILGSISNETHYERTAFFNISGGVILNWNNNFNVIDIYSGLSFQTHGLNEKSYDLFPYTSDTNSLTIRARYISIPFGVSKCLRGVQFRIGLTNSFLLNKKEKLNDIELDSNFSNDENWLIGLESRWGYSFLHTQKSQFTAFLYGTINSQSRYFKNVILNGFEIGYYALGIGLSCSIK